MEKPLLSRAAAVLVTITALCCLVPNPATATGPARSAAALPHGCAQSLFGARRSGSSTVLQPQAIPSAMRLRGGVELPPEPENPSQNFLECKAAMAEAKKQIHQLEQDLKDQAEENDHVMGYSPWGTPLGFKPNPDVAVTYDPKDIGEDEDEAAEKREKHDQRWDPSYEDLEQGMAAAQFIKAIGDDFSPLNIMKKLRAEGLTMDDVVPRVNPEGTKMGSLKRLEGARNDLLDSVADFEADHRMLLKEMEKGNPAEVALEEELQMMRDKGLVNPYIALLHEWEKNKAEEHRSGSFAAQLRARSQPTFTVPVPAEPIAPLVSIELPRVTAPEQ